MGTMEENGKGGINVKLSAGILGVAGSVIMAIVSVTALVTQRPTEEKVQSMIDRSYNEVIANQHDMKVQFEALRQSIQTSPQPTTAQPETSTPRKWRGR